jgi:hypothetical protein|tara:strand:- start:56 stop:397 length:342 start_codon:yes stop_codon:yes gene_type:complete
MKKTKIKLARNAFAMHSEPVLTNFTCSAIAAFYAAFALSVCGWLLISTAGWELTIGILAIHMIPLTLCRLKARPSCLSPFSGKNLLKPASAGGRMGAKVTASAPGAERNNLTA